jgi:hypothetical protein
MKPLLVCFLGSFCLAGQVAAQRLDWKPDEFVPLTSLPWLQKERTMEEVLKLIFKEPDPEIRYPVLAEYFGKEVSVLDLSKAFNLCIKLEGTQQPSQLVGVLLPLWAKRDPAHAVVKVRELMERVILEGGPLALDSWEGPGCRLVSLKGFREAPYWLSPWSLGGLGPALAEGDQPLEARKRRMLEYAGLFVDKVGALPAAGPIRYPTLNRPLLDVLELPLPLLRGKLQGANEIEFDDPAYRAAVARMLRLDPASAAQWVDSLKGDRLGYLKLWAQLDRPGLLRWILERHSVEAVAAPDAESVLLGSVDDETRKRWLDVAARKSETGESHLTALLCEWARSDPESALSMAVEFRDADLICDVANRAVYGGASLYNTSHYGIGVLRTFDLTPVKRAANGEAKQSLDWHWGITEMEQWLDIDVAEAAEYGFKYLTQMQGANSASRESLIKLFSGDDGYASDSDMIDRTLCALRFWAMWKPEAMKKWIATLNDPEMQKALTWTLENPWGKRNSPVGVPR